MSKRQAKPTDAEKIAALPEPTEAEARAMAAAVQRRADRQAPPAIATERADSVMRSFPTHRDHVGWTAHVDEAFGTRSRHFAETSIAQLERVLRPVTEKAEPAPDQRLNYALALLSGMDPKDELQAALGVQIVAAHTLAMEFMGDASLAGNAARAEAYTNMATKLSRTMIAGVEAMAKLRPREPQRIEVIYVNGPANFGTQAVVHAVPAGGQAGCAALGIEQPHGPLPLAVVDDAGRASMRRQDPARYVVPGAGDQEPAALQIPRRDEPRRADREGERPVHLRAVDAGGDGSPPTRSRRSRHGAA